MTYVDGYLVPVPEGELEAYRALAEELAPKFREWGATRVVEAVEDDCPTGKLNDFHTAVLAEAGEKTVFSYVEWPSKEAREEGWKKMRAYMEAMPQPEHMPFDGKRMVLGGFRSIVDR
ncbi:DUF1428 domain-containing protein [Sphingomicrobium astaxanthinifaciens]|uniref:DUF1428 domain-containing protein n=1 Tax=Sphingomicrobium astaxanthinifaciens TaxID=1227949 RepID=UPI001FCB32B9|nr:DUF1428 domain-containing protein [Sphingomicrobium astaxanthinifaciens]MCJ7421386.1 DUF1428 domain-containing protein [Sphingomicrobium astaxanthinifaciens]